MKLKYCLEVLFLMGLLMQGIYADPTLLLHGEGTDGSPIILDSSVPAHTLSAVGDAKISTTQSKFGSSGSMYFDGAGDYVTVTSNESDFDLTSGDFTIETFIRFNAITSLSRVLKKYDSASNYYLLYFENYSGNTYIGFLVTNGSTSYAINLYSTALTNLTVGNWHHIALTRSSITNTYNLYFNGQRVASQSNSNTIGNINNNIIIGECFNGWMDEVRITKGTPPYTGSTITVPTAPFTVTVPAPTNLIATAGTSKVDLTWNAAAGVAGYKVKYRETGSSGSYNEIDVVASSNPSCTVNLTSYVQHDFIVTAYNAPKDTESSVLGPVTATPLTPPPPPIPSAPVLALPVAGNTEVVLSWGAVAGATGYTVKFGTTSGSYDNSFNVTGTTYACTGLTNGTTYYFVVSASNSNGEGLNSIERSTSPSTASSLWIQNGNDIYYNAGNVGINTSTPTTKLDVEGTVKANEVIVDSNLGLTVLTGETEIGAVNFSDGSTSPGGYVEYNQADNSMAIGTNGANAIEIDSSQNVTFKGNVTVDGGTINLTPSVTSNIVPKGYIRGMTFYGSGGVLSIMPGIAECNGHYFEITSYIQHNMGPLPSQEADLPIFHYIYIDDSAYPTTTIINSTDKPKWDESKLGWYRFYQTDGTTQVSSADKNDRCIGAVWIIYSSGTGGIIPAEYTEDGRVLFNTPTYTAMNFFNAIPPYTGDWAAVQGEEKCTPVNACGALFYIESHDEIGSFNPHNLTAAMLKVSNSSYNKLSSYGCYVTSASGWLYWSPFTYNGLQYKTGTCDEGFQVWILGYQMER